ISRRESSKIRPLESDQDQGRLSQCQEPVQEERHQNKNTSLLQVWREAAEPYTTTTTQRVQENSGRGEDPTVWNSHGEADWHQKTLSQRQFPRQKLSSEDERLELWRASTTDRVQGAMGRSEGNLCSRQEHVQEVLNMRVQDPREHPATTMVSTLWSHTRQGRERGQEHSCGRAEVQPQRASR